MKIPVKGQKCEKRMGRKDEFGSFAWKKSGKGYVLVGCPKGKLGKSGRCKVGLKAHAVVIRRKRGAACPAGYRRA